MSLILQISETLPIGQFEVDRYIPLYSTQNAETPETRALAGDILTIYDITEDGWAQADAGWLRWRTPFELTPAVVHMGASIEAAISIDPLLPDLPDRLSPDATIGVLAILENRVLLYTAETIGWTDLTSVTITAPSPDLLDFVEQVAYVKTQTTTLHTQPTATSLIHDQLALGRQIDIVYTLGDWGLIRTGQRFGWGLLADYDPILQGQMRGEMNFGLVNFRDAPTDGRVTDVLDYREAVLILGRNETGDWLHVRLKSGLDGWLATEYVDFDGQLEDLPIIE